MPLCVVICWVFFRAGNVNEAMLVLTNLFDWQTIADANRDNIVHLVAIIAGVMLLTIVPNPLIMIKKFNGDNKWLFATAAMLIWAIWHLNNYSEFLYFQF